MATRRVLRCVAIGAVALLAGTGGCNFDVTNPGPVQDEFLDDSGANTAIVNGIGRALSRAVNWISHHSAGVTRELHPTGGTGSFGLTVPHYNGELLYDEENAAWDNAQQARSAADLAVDRLQANLGGEFASSELAAEAYLWGGYAYRLLGENMCEAVIDESGLLPRSEFTTRAEEYFGNAIQAGTSAGRPDVVTAATAGRAAVRAFTNDWSGALADAASVPTDFVFALPYFDRGVQDENNRIHESTRNEPYKTGTVWGTLYELTQTDDSDPRTPWADSGTSGDGAVECCGPVPFYRQGKYPDRGSDIKLSSGAEMRLLEAEAALVNSGDVAGAMAIINALRTAAGVAPRTATTPDEAWTWLKRERGIAMWLEARRLGDFFRWDRDVRPGQLHPREVVGSESHMRSQDLCFPVARSERDTNPNVP